jgi:CRP/FNR family transcriptional regulator, dissimilatory nitrate respiration regulator
MTTPTWHQAPLFTTLLPEQRRKLEDMATSKRLAVEETLFLEDDPCTGFYVLVEGAIQLTRFGLTPGSHPTLAVVLPVSSFAEAAMFAGENFPATATALKPTKAVHFPKERFLRTMREDPDLALAIIHAQAVWLRKLTMQIQQLSASDSGDRLRHWLREHLPQKGALVLPVTKKALAAELGMTPETLSRGLRNFQDQGLIQVKGTQICRSGDI